MRSPLYDVEHAAGAEFQSWNDCLWASHFGDPVAEHHAVRTAVGMWDISTLHKWELRGRDATLALDRLFTNHVATLTPGEIRYGAFCDERGAMINDATVYRLTNDCLWVITSLASDRDHLLAHLAGDVTLREITRELAALQVQGPQSQAVLTRLGAAVAHLPYFHFLTRPVNVAGVYCWVSRVGYSGELGFELFCPPEQAADVWRRLQDEGARPYGLAAVETLRIEAGLLMVGVDFLPGHTTPFDVSLDPVVRVDKGEFLGHEALREQARQPGLGLATLQIGGGGVPAPGAAVTADEEDIGQLTSSCHSPTLDSVIGLARVKRVAATPGRPVQVETGGSAIIAPTPIYDPSKRRRRN